MAILSLMLLNLFLFCSLMHNFPLLSFLPSFYALCQLYSNSSLVAVCLPSLVSSLFSFFCIFSFLHATFTPSSYPCLLTFNSYASSPIFLFSSFSFLHSYYLLFLPLYWQLRFLTFLVSFFYVRFIVRPPFNITALLVLPFVPLLTTSLALSLLSPFPSVSHLHNSQALPLAFGSSFILTGRYLLPSPKFSYFPFHVSLSLLLLLLTLIL